MLIAPEGFRRSIDVRVRFAETDAQGVVYHANFLVYCEAARGDYFRGLGGSGAEHFWRRQDRSWDTVIAHAECDYRAPARFDDLLRVFIRLGRVGSASYTFEYKIVRSDGVLVCDAKTTQVSIDKETRKAHPLPADFVAALRAREEE